MAEVSKMSVRFYIQGSMSKVIDVESPAVANATIERALLKGIYVLEEDRHTHKKRFLDFYPPKSIVKVAVQAWQPDIPDQIESVTRNLDAVEITQK